MKKSPLGIIGDEIDSEVSEWIGWFDQQKPRPDGVEIRTANGKKVDQLTIREARQVAKTLKNSGIAVHALASAFGKYYYSDQSGAVNAEVIEDQMKMLRRLVLRADIFDTKVIRGFALWRDKDLTVMWPNIVKFYQQALEIVPEDMVIAIENEPATGCATLGDVWRLHLALGKDPRIRALWDLGNYLYDCTLVQGLREMDNVLDNLLYSHILDYAGLIALVHAKNCQLEEGAMEAKTVVLGQGEIDFLTIFEELAEAGYIGAIDLEPHRSPSGQLAEKMRAMPGGPGYGNPEACTEDWRVLCDLI